MFLIVVLGEWVIVIPMPVLATIIVMVSIWTFDWTSFKYLRKAPRADALVMVVTVLIVVMAGDLSKGVFVGVILSAIFFTAKVSKIKVKKKVSIDTRENIYSIKEQLFFASVQDFTKEFDNVQEGSRLVIDFTEARIWDDSGAGAVDCLLTKLKQKNVDFKIIGLDASSSRLLDSLSVPYVR